MVFLGLLCSVCSLDQDTANVLKFQLKIVAFKKKRPEYEKWELIVYWVYSLGC